MNRNNKNKYFHTGMRFEGEEEDVREIERELQRNSHMIRRPSKTYDNLFGIESLVETRVYDIAVINPNWVFTFPVRFFYDRRDHTAKFEIRERDMSWLIKTSHLVIPLLAKLTEQKFEKKKLIESKRINEKHQVEAGNM